MEYKCPTCNKDIEIQETGIYKCPYCKNLLSLEESNISEKLKKNTNEGVVCPKCSSNRLVIQNETEINIEHRGCLSWLLWILAAVLTFGLILIVPLLTNSKVKSKSHTVGICQNCGYKWRV